ncbi:MAG: hypothetical protein IJD01_03745, partial [Clostridia bacterium]|nr:hypothetical protein [Clostridia bacterium]
MNRKLSTKPFVASKENTSTSAAAPTNLPSEGSVNADLSYTPSRTAVRANALVRYKRRGAQNALKYLERAVNQNQLTPSEKDSIISELHRIAPIDVQKTTESLLPSQREFYNNLADGHRYNQPYDTEPLPQQSSSLQKGETSDSEQMPRYRGLSFEELASYADKDSINTHYSVHGIDLTPEETDNTWNELQDWVDRRQKILHGEISGPIPTYRGISYNNLAFKGGKNGIAFMYGCMGITLSDEELRRVADEVAIWEQTLNTVFSLPNKSTSPFSPYQNDAQLNITLRLSKSSGLKRQASSLLEEANRLFTIENWQSPETTASYISRFEALQEET